jgi:hypothetical protein
MTDAGSQPGWWLASDGRWYPPSSHPDPAHRARWASTPQPGLPTSEQPTEAVPTIPAPPAVPPVGMPPGPPPVYQPQGWAVPDAAAPAPGIPGLPAQVPMRVEPRPPGAWPTAGAGGAPTPSAATGNAATAAVASVAALLVCVGVFLPWIEASNELLVLERSGWHVGTDGRLALAAGFVAAAAAGVAWVGLRHLALKAALAITAVVLLAVFVVELLDVLDFEDRLVATVPGSSVSVGLGLWFVGAAGVLLAVAAALERSRIRLPGR